MSFAMSRREVLAILGSSLVAFDAAPARAATKLRVGKSVQTVFGYVPLDVGMKAGLFAKEGLEIEEILFTGGAKQTQALTAGAIDIALSGGSEMAFVAKGAPEIAVASIADNPAFMGICVANNSPIKTLDDLKGKKIGVTSTGSLTSWLVDELNHSKGWTSDKDKAVAVSIGGEPAAEPSALKTGAVDASMTSPANGYTLEEMHIGHLLVDVSSYVKDLELFTIFASTAIVQANPAAVSAFLRGWFNTVKYMKTHKAEVVQATADNVGYSAAVASKVYDALINKFSTTGRFPERGLEKLHASFVDLKVLDASADMSKLYTERFLPKA